MSKILLIGGGGFAKEVHEIAELCGHEVVGYVANAPGVVSLPHLGDVDDIPALQSRFNHVVVAFGAVNRHSLVRRAALLSRIGEAGLLTLPLVSPRATIAKGAQIAPGAIVAHGVVVSVDAQIGAYAILNTSAVVGHDAVIGDRAIIAPCAFIGGNATIGSDSLLGPNSVVLEGRTVGREVIVSVGSSVLRDVVDGMTILPTRPKALR